MSSITYELPSYEPTPSKRLRRVKCKLFIGEFFVANERNKYFSSFDPDVVLPDSSFTVSSVIRVKSHNFMVQSKEPENCENLASYEVYHNRKEHIHFINKIYTDIQT